jgi:bifunctional DNA-binding transcriptional regulator/antitoxin component of YhaV-PrlF toxin-antitoxin module
MAQAGEVKVSERGQMALPAQARHRWGLDGGGTLGWIDVGDAVLLVPGGMQELRRELLAAADWEGARRGFGDPDLTFLVDDQTLSALLRGDQPWPDDEVFTTGHWYLRLCQAVVRGAGGAPSGPLLSLPALRRERALRSVLELPDAVRILDWRVVAPVMATQLDGAGRGLNLLSREALAAASILQAQVVMAPGNENRLLRAALRRLSG